jgi:hypothetical protein
MLIDPDYNLMIEQQVQQEVEETRKILPVPLMHCNKNLVLICAKAGWAQP